MPTTDDDDDDGQLLVYAHSPRGRGRREWPVGLPWAENGAKVRCGWMSLFLLSLSVCGCMLCDISSPDMVGSKRVGVGKRMWLIIWLSGSRFELTTLISTISICSVFRKLYNSSINSLSISCNATWCALYSDFRLHAVDITQLEANVIINSFFSVTLLLIFTLYGLHSEHRACWRAKASLYQSPAATVSTSQSTRHLPYTYCSRLEVAENGHKIITHFTSIHLHIGQAEPWSGSCPCAKLRFWV